MPSISKQAQLSRRIFLKSVFLQALSVIELQGKWMTLSNLVTSINNCFSIKQGLELVDVDFTHVLLRMPDVLLCLSTRDPEQNSYGFYRYDLNSKSRRTSLFQIAPRTNSVRLPPVPFIDQSCIWQHALPPRPSPNKIDTERRSCHRPTN